VLIVVDPHSGVPVFRQLMDQVRFHIVSGLLTPGAELPPTRTLSAELGVNPMTISKAYNLLERDGLLERRPGRPLAVKEMAAKDMQTRKIEQLRSSLTEPVRIACQLCIDPAQATQAFSEMLSAALANQ
jgi:GntR family transcriptional regulator